MSTPLGDTTTTNQVPAGGSSSTYLRGDGVWGTPSGGSMTWPSGAGIAVYSGSSTWGTSLTAPSGTIVGISDSQALTNKDLTGAGNTFPTLNQSTTGSAAALSVSGQTGLITLTGIASTNRAKTVRDAADTILELGGSYTPTGTWTSLTMVTPVLGTPASGNLANCTFPTLNQNTTGSAASLSVSGQTGLLTFTGIISTNRIKTVRDAADTLLELGGSYTPTGTWTSLTLVTPVLGVPASGTLTNCTGLPAANIVAGTMASGMTLVAPVLGTPASGNLANCTFPTLNQNTTGSAASLSVSGQTGLITLTGIVSTNRIKTVRDAADTLLELGGSYTPTGTWTSMTLVTPALGTPASGVLSSCTGSPTFTTLGATTLNVTGITSLGSTAQTTVSAAGLLTKYNGVTTAGFGTAPIVFQQNSSLAFGTFNTGAAVTMETGTAGFYRISFNLMITTTFVTNTAVTLAFGWTDDQGARTLTLTGAALTAGTGIPALNATAVVSNSFVIHTTSAAITYTPAKTGSSATAGAAWVSIVVERLA